MAAETKVHVLSTGAMHCDLSWLLLAPPRVFATRQEPHRPSTWYECPTHAVLVQHPEGTLLWDTACPADWETRWAPTGLQDYFPYDAVSDDQLLDRRLAQLGLEPGDIDTLVLSHLHFDHAGNAQWWKDSGTRIVANETEVTEATTFDGEFKGAHLKADYEGLTFDTVKGDTEILPGVTLLETPGHTWGTMSLQVDLPDSGTIIFTSDAVYMGAAYGPPPVGAAIVWDNQAWLRSVEKIRSIAERTNATLVFGHDSEQLRTLRLAPDACYT